VLYPGAGEEQAAEEELNETRMTQPALFVVEYAMARQLEKWGMRPEVMIGHSLGEYVAACLAGVMSVEEGLRLVSRRGALMQEAGRGGMVAVMMSEEEWEERIRWKGLSLAAVNGPNQVVISGEEEEIEGLIEELKSEGREWRRLKSRQAYHSRMMEEAAERYVGEVEKVKLRRGEIEFISNVSGRVAKEEEVRDARYWGRQMRECVRFGDGLEELMRRSGLILVEVGPGETLSRLARRRGGRGGRRGGQGIISTMRGERGDGDDREYLTRAMGRLWMAGVEIEWKGYYEGERRRRVNLPTYPFERQRYWIEARRGERKESGEEQERGEREGARTEQVEPADQVSGSFAPSHPRPKLSTVYTVPANDREVAIAAIWQAALGVDKVGANDNFFELGGDSLLAIRVISQLKEEFKVDIPVAGLYERLTPRSVAALIGSLLEEDSSVNEPDDDSTNRSDRVLQRRRFQEERRLGRRRAQAEPTEAQAGSEWRE
jgi:phthiocerol/phenolphthiocerol synthesis type-I polyketide synthase E